MQGRGRWRAEHESEREVKSRVCKGEGGGRVEYARESDVQAEYAR